jgi:hypothetical protein
LNDLASQGAFLLPHYVHPFFIYFSKNIRYVWASLGFAYVESKLVPLHKKEHSVSQIRTPPTCDNKKTNPIETKLRKKLHVLLVASATRPTIQFKYKYNFDKGEWNQTNTNTILFKIKIDNIFTQIQLLNLTISNNFTNKFALRLKIEITI